MKEPVNEFTILDWIGISYTVVNLIGLLSFPLIAPIFTEIYSDFGSALPITTKVTLQPWFSLLCGLICLGIFTLQWFKSIRRTLRRRRAVIVISFVGATLAFAILVIGIYLPIFKMAAPIFY